MTRKITLCLGVKQYGARLHRSLNRIVCAFGLETTTLVAKCDEIVALFAQQHFQLAVGTQEHSGVVVNEARDLDGSVDCVVVW